MFLKLLNIAKVVKEIRLESKKDLGEIFKKKKERDQKFKKIIKKINNYNKSFKKFEIIIYVLISIILIFLQKYLVDFKIISKKLSEILDGSFLDVYTFVITLLSLYGIYLALIQFVVEISSKDNTYFAVNYARRSLEESNVFRFLRSKLFYLYLLILAVLPAIYKLEINYYIDFLNISINELITYFWNAIAILLILIFIISLNFAFTTIWDISYRNVPEKRMKCYETINFFTTQLFEIYIINEEVDSGVDSLDIFFDHILDLKTRFKDNKFEENYFMNNFLENCNIDEIKRKEDFFNKLIEILVSEHVELIYNEEYFKVDYPLFTVIKNLGNSYIDEKTTIFQKNFSKVYEFLNNQETIISVCFSNFIIDMLDQFEYEHINKILYLYMNKCKYINILEYRLMLKDRIIGIDNEEILSKDVKYFYIWIKLFTEYEKEKVKLTLPINGSFYLNKRKNDYPLYSNIYNYAAMYYLNCNPTSIIFKEIYYSLSEFFRDSYDKNFKTVIFDKHLKIYTKLVNEYEKIQL